MNHVLGDRKAVLLLLGPAFLVYTAVMLVPSIWSMGYTLFQGNAISGFTWAGTDNIVRLFTDGQVRDALGFTVQYALVMSVLQVALGYGLALMYVFVLRRASSVVRTFIFFPVVLPTVAVALLFQRLFAIAPQPGLVNETVSVLGFEMVDFFGSGGSAFLVIILMDLWRSMGFYGVLLYAGVLDIPEELIESARLDGATGLGLVRHIILPLSLPVLLSAVIFSINGTLKVFDSILALTGGGPGTETAPLTLYMFQTAFSFGDYGFGSAIATLLTVLCLLVTLAIFRSWRRDATRS